MSPLPPGSRYGVKEAFAAWRSPPPTLGGAVATAVPGARADHKSVEWMPSQVEDMLAGERTRMESFRTRGGQLAGFGAVFLGLLAALLPDGLDELEGVWCSLGVALFAAGLALVLGSILMNLVYVVQPIRGRGISPSLRLARYLATAALLQAEPWQLQLRTLRGYPDILSHQAWLNRRLAGALYLASVALAAGLLATAFCLVILLLHG